MEGMSPSEVLALAKDNDGFGGNSWLGMIIVLFFLVYGMNGNWNGNGFAHGIGYENPATSNEVQRGFDNQNSMSNQREILAAVNSGTAQAVATTNQMFHDLIGYFGDKYNEITRDIAGLSVGQANMLAKANECCCEILRGIDGVNYNNAMLASQITMAIKDDGAATRELIKDEASATRELITGNRMADMQTQINRLETAQMLSPIEQRLSMVPTYPNTFGYTAGPNPFCQCNPGCFQGNL